MKVPEVPFPTIQRIMGFGFFPYRFQHFHSIARRSHRPNLTRFNNVCWDPLNFLGDDVLFSNFAFGFLLYYIPDNAKLVRLFA